MCHYATHVGEERGRWGTREIGKGKKRWSKWKRTTNNQSCIFPHSCLARYFTMLLLHVTAKHGHMCYSYIREWERRIAEFGEAKQRWFCPSYSLFLRLFPRVLLRIQEPKKKGQGKEGRRRYGICLSGIVSPGVRGIPTHFRTWNRNSYSLTLLFKYCTVAQTMDLCKAYL